MSITRSLANQLPEIVRVAPTGPAVSAGFRAGVATMTPLLIGYLIGQPERLLWAGLIGFTATLIDPGGMYRVRALTLGTLTVCGVLAGIVAALAGSHPVISIVAMLVWGTLGGMARVYGASAGSVGLISSIIFVVSLAHPLTEVTDALQRGGIILVGGLWAMMLALVLWPLRLYRPARLALAACYRALARFAEDLAHLAEDPTSRTGQQADFAQVREALEVGRSTLANIRRGRPGESPRGERLLILLENADQMLASLVSLADVLEEAVPASAGRRIADELHGFAVTAEEIAAAIESEKDTDISMPLTWGENLPASEFPAQRDIGDLRTHQAARILGFLRETAEAAADAACRLSSGQPIRNDQAQRLPDLRQKRPWHEPLRENLSFDSVLLRHALRVGLTTAAGVLLAEWLDLQRGYWITLTVVIILQPYTSATVVKGLQRVLGTVLGGILAALITGVLHDPLALLSLVFLLAGFSVAFMPLNYGLFSIFLTPTFVLLVEVGSGDAHLWKLRILNTFLGGVLAIAGAFLLWSMSERKRFPGHLTAALRASRRYLRAMLAALARGEPTDQPRLAARRRRLGLEIINAETSFQRLLSETGLRSNELESWMALLTYLRRIGAAVTALAATPRGTAPHPDHQALEDIGRILEDELRGLEKAIAEGRPPLRPAELRESPPIQDTLLRVQVQRLIRLVRVLHTNAWRAYAAESEALYSRRQLRQVQRNASVADSLRPD